MAAAPLQISPRINHLTHEIIAAAMKVHTVLGPGLLESAFHACLVPELRKHNLVVPSQVGLPVIYESRVIVEIKCVEAINPVHKAQRLSYMRLSGRQVGLLINFHFEHLKDGIKRMVDGYDWQKPLTTEGAESHRGNATEDP
jgi:hypothetical protein